MNRDRVEKFGTVGAVIAAAACPICFPKVALIGAAVGLGMFAPYEAYIAVAVQALFVLAFVGQTLSFRRHRNFWLLLLSATTTGLVFVAYYGLKSSLALQVALAGLVIASVWQMIELKRSAKCAETRAPIRERHDAQLRGGHP
jgi:mercuric ion transport protein